MPILRTTISVTFEKCLYDRLVALAEVQGMTVEELVVDLVDDCIDIWEDEDDEEE